MASMNATRLGRTIRALRVRQHLRQADVGRAAAVSQSLVSLVERGQFSGIRLRVLESIVQEVGGELRLSIQWRGGDVDRLLDEGHAALMGRAVDTLEKMSWHVRPEVTFANYADRGSIDLLAWHPGTSTVLVVEIKTELTSIEDTLRTHDMKTRNALKVARERAGWEGRATARLLVLPDSSTARRRVTRNEPVIRRAYPLAGIAARSWLQAPSGATGLLMFLPFTNTARGRCGPVSRRRVRAPRPSVPEHGSKHLGRPGPARGPDVRA